MDRITDKDLQAAVDRINRLTGSPAKPYEDGKACIGNYHLSHAYGGVALHRMHNEGGGITTPLGGGHGTKRDLYGKLHAYIADLEAAMPTERLTSALQTCLAVLKDAVGNVNPERGFADELETDIRNAIGVARAALKGE